MSEAVLALNAGSSGWKFALFGIDDALPMLFRGRLEPGNAQSRLRVQNSKGNIEYDVTEAWHASMGDELAPLFAWLAQRHLRLRAVGHRIVHGGERYFSPVVIDDEVVQRLEALSPLAPLHQARCLMAVAAVRDYDRSLPQVACFDTAFHLSQPAWARTFALPRELTASGIRRYGFHGLSFEFVVTRLGELPASIGRNRVVIAHLGNGASLCALQDLRSVATTMGFSALDGLVMGTRCGGIDPGVLLYLMMEKGYSAEQVSELLYKRSGLFGLSGISHDVRVLLSSSDARAAEAMRVYVHRIVRELGGMVACLGGLDTLVFTGGVGENAAEVRAAVCEQLAWLGVELDGVANDAGMECLSCPGSRVSVWKLATDEERVIARHVRTTLSA